MITASDPSNEQLLTDVKVIQFRLNVTPDYKFFILINAIFTPTRGILENWTKYEEIFLTLVKQAGAHGGDRLLQALCLYFNKNQEQQKHLVDFFKLLYKQRLYEDETYKEWFAGNKKLDKNSVLYDRKAEKDVRPQLAAFIDWLDYGEEDDYGEEEVKQVQAPAAKSTQSQLIEAQKRAQQE